MSEQTTVPNSLSNRVRLRIQDRASEGAEWPKFSLTMRQIAREAGCSAATLSRFMQGHQVTSEVLDKLDNWCWAVRERMSE